MGVRYWVYPGAGRMKSSCERLWQGAATTLLLLFTLYPVFLHADEIRPAMLQIEEREAGWVDVTWKIPVRGDRGELHHDRNAHWTHGRGIIGADS